MRSLLIKSKTLWVACAITALPQVSTFAGQDGMPGMPVISPKHSYTVSTSEQGADLQEKRGFGDQEPMVKMMNLMMVGGSGMEGMSMDMGHAAKKDGMKMADNTSPTSHQEHESMSMSHDKYEKSAPAGYAVQAVITPDPPQVGSNLLVVNVAKGDKPAAGLKLKSEVAMTSMDMGTEHPVLKEISPGKYQLKAVFAMKGPWAVKVTFPSGETKILNFSVGNSN